MKKVLKIVGWIIGVAIGYSFGVIASAHTSKNNPDSWSVAVDNLYESWDEAREAFDDLKSAF